jgi:hypothetical protein
MLAPNPFVVGVSRSPCAICAAIASPSVLACSGHGLSIADRLNNGKQHGAAEPQSARGAQSFSGALA